jgi:hypothetical protein
MWYTLFGFYAVSESTHRFCKFIDGINHHIGEVTLVHLHGLKEKEADPDSLVCACNSVDADISLPNLPHLSALTSS